MNTIRLFTTLLLFLWTTSTGLAGNPAGIVLYLMADDEVYLLLADHTSDSERGWSGFGGGGEQGESPAETAARETEEETRGYFNRADLFKGIEQSEPVIDGTFHLYFLEIGFVPAVRIQNNRPKTENETYRERGPYAWIPYSEVAPYVEGVSQDPENRIDRSFLPRTADTDWFWDVWLRNMRKAHRMGALPWCESDDDA